MSWSNFFYNNLSYFYLNIQYLLSNYDPYYNENSSVNILYKVSLYGWPHVKQSPQQIRNNPQFEKTLLITINAPYDSLNELIKTWNKKYIIDHKDFENYHLFEIKINEI